MGLIQLCQSDNNFTTKTSIINFSSIVHSLSFFIHAVKSNLNENNRVKSKLTKSNN